MKILSISFFRFFVQIKILPKFEQLHFSMPKGHASATQKKRNQQRLQAQELITKEEMQVYGLVMKVLGDRRYRCRCDDGKERICKTRGKLGGRLFVNAGDIMLISLREEDDTKGDIIQKYSPDEIHELKKMGEFTDKTFQAEDDDDGIGAVPDDNMINWTNEDIDKV